MPTLLFLGLELYSGELESSLCLGISGKATGQVQHTFLRYVGLKTGLWVLTIALANSQATYRKASRRNTEDATSKEWERALRPKSGRYDQIFGVRVFGPSSQPAKYAQELKRGDGGTIDAADLCGERVKSISLRVERAPWGTP